MQAMIDESEVKKSSPLASCTKISVTMLMKYKNTNAKTAKTTRFAMTVPPTLRGRTMLGCTSMLSSRCACLASTSVRIILMPPPVEPELAAMQLKNIIHMGAKIRSEERRVGKE